MRALTRKINNPLLIIDIWKNGRSRNSALHQETPSQPQTPANSFLHQTRSKHMVDDYSRDDARTIYMDMTQDSNLAHSTATTSGQCPSLETPLVFIFFTRPIKNAGTHGAHIASHDILSLNRCLNFEVDLTMPDAISLLARALALISTFCQP